MRLPLGPQNVRAGSGAETASCRAVEAGTGPWTGAWVSYSRGSPATRAEPGAGAGRPKTGMAAGPIGFRRSGLPLPTPPRPGRAPSALRFGVVRGITRGTAERQPGLPAFRHVFHHGAHVAERDDDLQVECRRVLALGWGTPFCERRNGAAHLDEVGTDLHESPRGAGDRMVAGPDDGDAMALVLPEFPAEILSGPWGRRRCIRHCLHPRPQGMSRGTGW